MQNLSGIRATFLCAPEVVTFLATMFARFDVFPKFSDRSVRVKTVSGGIISLAMVFWVVFLFVGRVAVEFNRQIESSIVVDTNPTAVPRKAFIALDVLVDASCTVLHVDLFEDDGSVRTDIIENLTRIRLDETGTSIEAVMERKLRNAKKEEPAAGKCGSCYGARPSGECCNSCADVVRAFKQKGWSFFGADRWDQCVREGIVDFGREKCEIKGALKVKVGKGNFHIGLGANSIGSGKGHAHDVTSVNANHSLSHVIKKLRIGPKLPGFEPPLNDVSAVVDGAQPLWFIGYYLNVVPSRHIAGSQITESYRYSVMYSQREVKNTTKKGVPGIHFYYDFSPMTVVSQRPPPSLINLMNPMAGIIGGAFSFAAIIDALMFGALSTLEGKRSIGKDV